MSKTRVYEFAKQLNISSKDVLETAKKLGIQYNSHMSTMMEGEMTQLTAAFAPKPAEPKKQEAKMQPASKPVAKQEPKRDVSTAKASGQPHGKQVTVRQAEKNHSNKHQTERFQKGQHSSQKGEQHHAKQENKPMRRQEVSHSSGKEQERTQEKKKDWGNKAQRFDAAPQQKQYMDNKKSKRPQTKTSYQQDSFENDAFERGGKKLNKNRNQQSKKSKPLAKQEAKKALPQRKFHELPEVLVYTDGMTVAEIAKKIKREPAEIIKKLFMLGVMATQNQALGKDAIELLAVDYGMEAEEKIERDTSDLNLYFDEVGEENRVSRPPVVTIMGHVDHGKTTLLDQLRNSSVVEGEAGGITQHIGAYQIKIDDKPITFLDTPGHAAFTTMRARGADITDITIIVVAADDGVMPQTIEAINHAKAANVPMIVAVNKIDKPAANPDRVMQELSELGLIPEAWGGDTIFVPISAKFNQNIDELLEMILLVAEMQELKANPNRLALGTVIEARLDKAKGAIATLLVQEGTLKVGDPIVVGNTFGRVRAMVNDQGRRVKSAGPAKPVEITGLNASPQAGDRFVVFEDEKSARAAGEERAKRALIEQRNATHRITLDNLFASLKDGEMKEVNVIIKADVQGSVEALASSLQKIDVEGVRVRIVHSAVGAINESDVTLALASNAIMIGFNVRPTPQAKAQADADQVDIRLHRIIYNVIDEIETAMKGMLDPEYEEKVTGSAIVRETYVVSKLGTIAGAYVTDGFIRRNSQIRLIRDNIVIYEGELSSLKRFKDDVKEVKLGFECGMMIAGYNDIKMDDMIEAFEMVEIKRK